MSEPLFPATPPSLVERLQGIAAFGERHRSETVTVYATLLTEAADALTAAGNEIEGLEKRLLELNPGEVFSSSTPMGSYNAYQKVVEDRDELQALFDLQFTRMHTATVAWRKAHPGNDLVQPDLGALLTWLLRVAHLGE